MSENLDKDEYRRLLIETEQKAQEGFDKAILSLSGGALGISFAFVSDIVPLDSAGCLILLLLGWFCWTVAVALTLLSYFSSTQALRKAIEQLDDKKDVTPDTGFDKLTQCLNIWSGILFIAGVLLVSLFVATNVWGGI